MAIGKTIGKLSIRVIPDASKFRNDLKLLIERVEKSMAANLTVRADTREAMLEIAKLRNEAQRNGIQMAVGLNDKIAEARLLALQRPRTVRINADVDESSFGKVIKGSKGIVQALSGWSLVRQTIDDFKGRLLALPTAVPSIAKVALAVGNLGALAVSSIGGLATVATNLGQLVGLLPALPGILLGAGIGLGTLMLAAKDGPKYLGGLKQPLSDLQTMVSTTFWGKAAGPINNLVTGLLPQLQAGFKNVSGALGEQAAAVASAIGTALSGGVLEGWFGKVAESMRIITPHVGSFVSAFVTLGTVGLGFMPDFAKWVGGIGDDFNAWVQAAASGGQFNTWMTEAIASVKNLFSIGGSLISIVGSLNSAAVAAGGNGLTSLAGVLSGIATTLASPAVQSGMTALFAGAGAGVSALGSGIVSALGSLGGLAPTLGGVLKIAGETLGTFVANVGKALNQPAVKTGLTDLFTGLQSGLGAVGEVLPAVAEVLGHVGTALGTAFTTFGPLLAAMKETFAPKLVILADAANDLIPVLGGALTGAIKALQPPLEFVFGIISSNMPLFEGLVVALGGGALAFMAVTKAVGLFQAGLAIVKGVQAGFAAATYGAAGATYAQTAANKVGAAAAKAQALAQALISGALYNQVTAMVAAGGAWVAQKARIIAASVATRVAVLADLAKQAAAWVAQKATLVAAAAQWALMKGAQIAGAAATGIATAAQWLFNAAMSANPIALVVIAIAALVAGLVLFFTKTEIGRTIWAGFIDFLTNAWNGLVTVATTVFSAIGTFISGVWNGIVTAATTAWNAVVSFLGTWWPVILAVLAPVLGLGILIATHWNEIVAVVRTVWDGVVSWVSGAVENVSAVVQKVVGALSTWWTTTWEAISQTVTDIWNTITEWIAAAIIKVKAIIDEKVALIKLAWALFWDGIKTKVTEIWNGITTWISEAIAKVKSAIEDKTALIKKGWETVWDGIKTKVTEVWNGITGWISEAIGKVKSSIEDKTALIKKGWETVWDGIKEAVSNAWDGIKGLVEKIVGGIKGLIGDVKETLGDLPTKVKEAFTNSGTWLYNAGKSIIQGLIDGISGMIEKAKGAAKGVMDAIANFFPHSPAKEGPFSGKGWTTYSGAAIGSDLAKGMTSTVGTVRKSALGLMSAASAGSASIGVAAGVTPSAAALTGGGGITIQGNVGWQPQELLREAELRQRQQQMAYGIDGLAALA